MISSKDLQFPDMTRRLIGYIENQLASVYGFDTLTSASAHLLSKKDVDFTSPKEDCRALTLFEETGDEIFIGLYIDAVLIETLERKPPLVQLNLENMDAFCVIVEEVSHFHLILQRKNHALEASHTELEFQAELDKLLLAAQLLFEQVRHPHIFELINFIFESGVLSIKDEPAYSLAQNMALKVWKSSWATLKSHSAEKQLQLARALVKDFYKKSFIDKKSLISSGSFLNKIA